MEGTLRLHVVLLLCRYKMNDFPIHDRLTVEQTLDHAKSMDLERVLVLGTDKEGMVRQVTSHMSRENSVFKLLEEIGRIMDWNN